MTRIQALLTVLVSVLLIVLFWFLVYTPMQEDIEQLEAQTADEELRHQQLEARIESLRAVRQDAPETEAALAAARAIIPNESALPSALRQMQGAADDSGIVLSSVATARPTPLDDDLDVHSITVSVQVTGTYFQTVDFLRRIEDPTITPRGVLWQSVSVSRGDDYPELSVALSGSMFAAGLSPAAEEEPEPDPDSEDDELMELDPDDDTEPQEEPG